MAIVKANYDACAPDFVPRFRRRASTPWALRTKNEQVIYIITYLL